MAVLLNLPYSQFFDDNGNPLAGGLIYTYSAGTTTPKATYTDSSEITPAANPVVLDSAGRAAIWIVGSYRIDVKTSADVLVRSVDNITAYTTGGDMTKAVYDAANIAQQVIGATAVQTLTNKTLNQPNLVGTTTNDNAAAGSVGEIIEGTRAVGSAISITSTVGISITSISLTAGDWNVWGNIGLVPSSTITKITGSVSQVNNTDATAPSGGAFVQFQLPFTSALPQVVPVGMTRISLASTTTIYLVTTSTFAGTCTAYGYLGARRAR